jgi:mono/diheme cytochrome c family protein
VWRPAAQWQWTAVAVVLCILVGITATGCGGSAASRGEKVYAMQSCAICHGKQREGSKLGPPLTGLKAHWTADQLVRDYFPDPVTYQNNDPRLREMLKTYNTMKMPAVRLPEADQRALADWLLTDPAPVGPAP